MVILTFALVLVVPFALGCAAMALRASRAVKSAVVLSPLALLVLLFAGGFFWLDDIGAAIVAVIATWAWFVGVGMSRDVRRFLRFVGRGARRPA